MTGEGMYDEHLQQFIAKTAPFLSQFETPPTGFTELAQSLQPHLDSVKATLDQLAAQNSPAGILARQQDTLARIAASFGSNLHPLPVPTPQELSDAEADLRARVLPEAPEEELQQAVEKIPADPEKLKLAAFLTDLLQRAASISTPWAVFVLVFWVAMKVNPNEVGALALAYAVMCNVKLDT